VRQVASVIKDGRVVYFIADAEEGELAEFATVAVPASFAPVDAIKLGFNLISAVGLNGHRMGSHTPLSVPRAAVKPALPRRRPSEWTGATSVVEYVAGHPGCKVAEIVAHFAADAGPNAVSSAVSRAAAHGGIVRDNGFLWPGTMDRPLAVRGGGEKPRKWAVTIDQVLDYVRAHPGCWSGEIATALLGENTRDTKQVIGNRLRAIENSTSRRGFGPRFDKSYRRQPNVATDTAHYTLVEEPSVE
jgi:hypothetical protein